MWGKEQGCRGPVPPKPEGPDHGTRGGPRRKGQWPLLSTWAGQRLSCFP